MERKIEADFFKKDFIFLYHALLHHPSLYRDEQLKRNFMQLYQSKADKVCSYDSLINAATELTVFFMDGHTNIEVPYSTQDFCIPLCCKWDECESSLILSRSYEEIPVNAEIISINGKTVETLISLMSKRIPHENTSLVKSRMIMYPYQNYHLFSKMSLNYLFGVQTSYDILFLVNGERIEKQCYLKNYNGFLDFPSDSEFITYEIHNDKMILHLNACIFNEQYKRTLETAARLCQEKNITLFILDLSQNMGGNSAVIDEFITYTNVDSFKRYEMIDYSSGEAKQITSRQKLIINKKKSICFPDTIFCKVSCNTFSSAKTFAVTLKDNGIAKMIGTETGGKPNSYGMPKKSQMPGSNVRFRVSTSYFMRPDKSKDDAITLKIDGVNENDFTISRKRKRGSGANDEKEFYGESIKKLKKAAEHIKYLINEGYAMKSASVFVGNHFLLSERQRLALVRSISSDEMLRLRKEKECMADELKGKTVHIDGFNTIITLEIALCRSLLLRCMDNTIRDLAGLRGTYRLINETQKAVEMIADVLEQLKIKKAVFYLDAPVSNSGRLKSLIEYIWEHYHIELDIYVINNVDQILQEQAYVITSDAIILDKCKKWFNLMNLCIEKTEAVPMKVW